MKYESSLKKHHYDDQLKRRDFRLANEDFLALSAYPEIILTNGRFLLTWVPHPASRVDRARAALRGRSPSSRKRRSHARTSRARSQAQCCAPRPDSSSSYI